MAFNWFHLSLQPDAAAPQPMSHSQTCRSHPACPRLGKGAGCGFPGRRLRLSSHPKAGRAGGSRGPSLRRRAREEPWAQSPSLTIPRVLVTPRLACWEGWERKMGPLGYSCRTVAPSPHSTR